ncbi:sulfotransferase [Asticcacaulis sp. 201]|uniref:sulfotransferase n=1 Tax=Asticcacaulis sp. 201 TaxID=3028787 RepID=UPI0029160663|nr:sulfotransferase [Asticcacaulis sp. 201]MDV6330928.1 sulfotransferase [Asticcacaulis sp. 201]
MRLSRPFFQLPVLFDVDRLQAEVAALPAEAWVAHPDQVPGNSAARLISAGGEETDAHQGQMLPTRWLSAMPYLRQSLAGFGVVWSRSRLMRLAPGTGVPEHADINYHWHSRVRLHIPIFTRPEVRFHCDGQSVHMAAGEAWIFDNWRRHHVENRSDVERIHLVADTSGTASFWQFACGEAPPRAQWPRVGWDPQARSQLLTEGDQRAPVMPPAEVQLLVDDLRAELVVAEAAGGARSADGQRRAGRFNTLLESFVQDWRQLCALHGTGGAARADFQRLAGAVREAAEPLADGLVMRTNNASAWLVLEKRVLQHLVADAAASQPRASLSGGADRALERPIFIIAAPRSGSTLLYETLACTPGFNTFGGEAHWLIEDHPALRPGAPGVDSNRLTAADATVEICAAIRQSAVSRLQGLLGHPPAEGAPLLEKTPKNSLRIPLIKQVFPDARFIFLWRDPRENLSSIIEAWRAGGWITYRALPGWEGPWSLLLPPGWQFLQHAPLEAVAAWQWRCANDTALDDLRQLPPEDWTSVNYHDFLADPAEAVRRLCRFSGVAFDAALQARTAGQLPASRHTHTPPSPDKWRRNADAILRVLPGLDATWHRLRALG